jgi:hypothetical protein
MLPNTHIVALSDAVGGELKSQAEKRSEEELN